MIALGVESVMVTVWSVKYVPVAGEITGVAATSVCVPVPESCTVSATLGVNKLAPFWVVMVIDPVNEPVVVGVKLTFRVQEAPTASAAEKSHVPPEAMAKSPVMVPAPLPKMDDAFTTCAEVPIRGILPIAPEPEAKISGALPVLVRVSVNGTLVVFKFWLPNCNIP